MSSPVLLPFGTEALGCCPGGPWRRRRTDRGASSPLQKPHKRSCRSLALPGNCRGPCRPDGHTGEAHLPLPSQVWTILPLVGGSVSISLCPSVGPCLSQSCLWAPFSPVCVCASLIPRSPASGILSPLSLPSSRLLCLLSLQGCLPLFLSGCLKQSGFFPLCFMSVSASPSPKPITL